METIRALILLHNFLCDLCRVIRVYFVAFYFVQQYFVRIPKLKLKGNLDRNTSYSKLQYL